jgi:DNA-binding GntR family transcriptional regulator
MDLDYLREFKATLLANTELQTFFDMDDAFHSYIVAQTKNIYLINTSRSISDHNMRLRVLSGKSVEKRVEVTTSEHTEIIDHLINGEIERAVEALVDHLEKAKEASYISMLKSYDLSLTAQI